MTQVGLVVRDIEAKSKAWADLLGVDVPEVIVTDERDKAHTQFKGEPTEARAKLAFFNLDNIQIELIEPIGGPSTWREFLDTHGEGVHHIAFHVDDMQQQVLMLKQKNMNLEQKGDFTGGSYAYIDGQEKLGVLLELLTSTEK
ncbi:MAG: VOC family protein [candidate division KSB1 bacterium]|nr:VOC family protein [candidate division KSB1 bacterium]